MGADYSYAHAAFLCANLPDQSRVSRAINPDLAYSVTDLLLREIEYELRVLVWQRTKDGHSGRNEPKRIDMPSASLDLDARKLESDRAYVDSVLNPRG